MPLYNDWDEARALGQGFMPPKEELIDYSPDHRPSDTAYYIRVRGQEDVWALGVRGLGVILMTANGLGAMDQAEMGWSPQV